MVECWQWVFVNDANSPLNDSLMLWEYLVHYLNLTYIQKDDKTLSYASRTISYLKILLKDVKWLKSNYSDEFVKPSEVIFQDLDASYICPDEIKQYLTIEIKFKPDRIKQIEEEFNCVLVGKSEFDEFQEWKKSKEIQHHNFESVETDNTLWKPETTPNQIQNIQVNSYKGSSKKMNLSYQSPYSYSTQNFHNEHYDNPKNRQAIGDWGENFVNSYLIEHYKNDTSIEVKWLNKDSYLGVGYDFVILKDSVEIEYIEVKSKIILPQNY